MAFSDFFFKKSQIRISYFKVPQVIPKHISKIKSYWKRFLCVIKWFRKEEKPPQVRHWAPRQSNVRIIEGLSRPRPIYLVEQFIFKFVFGFLRNVFSLVNDFFRGVIEGRRCEGNWRKWAWSLLERLWRGFAIFAKKW